MSNLFKLVIEALTKMSEDEVRLAVTVANALWGEAEAKAVLDQHAPTQTIIQVKAPYTDAQVRRAADAARKRKANGKPKAKPKRTRKGHTGFVGTVWTTMQQSTGALTTKELAELLSVKQQKVASALNQLSKSHPAVLRKEWVKGQWDSAAEALSPGYYKYQYKGVQP